MDNLSKEQRSFTLPQVHSKNTKPEKLVKSALQNTDIDIGYMKRLANQFIQKVFYQVSLKSS